jgi:hypothetical protein
MDHYDAAAFVPRSDSTLVAITAGIGHMAANIVSAILSRTDRRDRVAFFGAFSVAHATLHFIDISSMADSTVPNP